MAKLWPFVSFYKMHFVLIFIMFYAIDFSMRHNIGSSQIGLHVYTSFDISLEYYFVLNRHIFN